MHPPASHRQGSKVRSLLSSHMPSTQAGGRDLSDSTGRAVGGSASLDQASIEEFQLSALRSRTPRSFARLLTRLQSLIPYRFLVCGWGYPRAYRVSRLLSVGYPTQFMQWYFTTGMLRRDPVFAEWLRTRRPQIWIDVARRLPDQFDPGFLKRAEKIGLQYSLFGGTIETRDHEMGCCFAVVMSSEQDCRTYLSRFRHLLHFLSQAFRESYPQGTLSRREEVILKLRAMGHHTKQIADEIGISPRTVKKHFESVKTKLYTDDLLNAVVIATRLGMLDDGSDSFVVP